MSKEEFEKYEVTIGALLESNRMLISKNNIVQKILELAKEAIELAYLDLEPYEWTDMPDGRIVLETVEKLRDVLAEIDSIEQGF